MSLSASGAISLSNINTELGFAATALISMNTALVRGLAGVASGAINLNSFHGKSSAFAFNAVIAANTTDYNLKSAAIAAGWNQTTPLKATVTVNAGVYVYASSTGVYGFNTGITFPAGSSLSLINNGYILGHGGGGGSGAISVGNGSNGGAGGPAFIAQNAISITNNGIIGGGGGGGGSGGYVARTACPGGGGGIVFGAAGAGGNSSSPTAGSLVSAGAGGFASQGGVRGGAGGGYGSGGGSPSYTPGGGYLNGSPGAGGAAVAGNANITWVAVGTRYGAIV